MGELLEYLELEAVSIRERNACAPTHHKGSHEFLVSC
jgi:hypothetical protein